MAAADLSARLEELRPYLVRYASVHLRNPGAAEDAVQEALLAALTAQASFEGRSDLRTWITGILKHKCVDAVRRAGRESPLAGDDAETAASEFDALFDERGHWHEHPKPWEDPDAALHQMNLPARTAQVFMLREHMGLAVEEICEQLGITAANCSVLLYRARMALRLCLERNWFAK